MEVEAIDWAAGLHLLLHLFVRSLPPSLSLALPFPLYFPLSALPLSSSIQWCIACGKMISHCSQQANRFVRPSVDPPTGCCWPLPSCPAGRPAGRHPHLYLGPFVRNANPLGRSVGLAAASHGSKLLLCNKMLVTPLEKDWQEKR